MKLIILVAVLVCASQWANAQKCCTATQFEASYGGNVLEWTGGRVLSIQEYFQGAFDFKSRSYAMDVYVKTGGKDQMYKVIQLFSKNKQYVIMGSTCQTSPITAPEPSRCVPDDAQKIASVFLGQNELLLDDYLVNVSQSGVSGVAYTTVTQDDCTPVSNSFTGKSGLVSIHTGGSYYNFTQGIKDPSSWFVPPSSCTNLTGQIVKDPPKPFSDWQHFHEGRFFF